VISDLNVFTIIGSAEKVRNELNVNHCYRIGLIKWVSLTRILSFYKLKQEANFVLETIKPIYFNFLIVNK